ncbi:MAG: TetR/AcrR family transcriptional regulator [Rhizobiales bacterium]|nr:TetR/AcrR family transcriptional regulator [Hyphomicrobiales bacterium]
MHEDKGLTKKQLRRKEQIIEAAILVFGRDRDLNLDKIIKISGGSKGAIYDFFNDKDGLQKAVNEEIFRRIDLTIGTLLEQLDDLSGEDGLESEKFKAFVFMLMKTFTDPKVRQFIRLLLCGLYSRSEFSAELFAKGPDKFLKGLERFLLEVAEAGNLTLHNPKECSSLLFGMITTHFIWEGALLEEDAIISDEDLEKHCDCLVNIFRYGFAETLNKQGS